MHRIILCCLILLSGLRVIAQGDLRVTVIDAATRQALPGATIRVDSSRQTRSADSLGHQVFDQLAPGPHLITVTFIGYQPASAPTRIPARDSAGTMPTELLIQLDALGEEEEEVIVQSTRTSRSIRNVPTRVETIGLEEIDEKNNMRPANISMLLHESTGIQVQQTSATSANASIRIQGLDGRYTQLLKNGFGNYGNFASGLSVLEIPPLDLQQVEIIKGPASTLYGGGAIAGVINLISRTPGKRPVNDFLLNQSHVGQTNFGYFGSGRSAKTGYTVLASFNHQRAYDVDHDDFTELPRTTEFTLHPTLFLYPTGKSTIVIGNSFSQARREGGDLQVIRNKADAGHQYFEQNNTTRNITTVEWKRALRNADNLTVKQSFSVFDRHIAIPDYHFDGISYNSFTDASLLLNRNKHSVVTGVNVVYDRFDEKPGSADDRDNRLATGGLYAQDSWDVADRFRIESGLRLDAARFSNPVFRRTEYFLLPRISLLFKYNEALTSRIGGGLGYKTPSLFTERTENFQYRNVLQLDSVRSERSYGFTGDIDLKKRLGPLFSIAINQMFFYTAIQRPLITEDNGAAGIRFVNMDKPVRSAGFETNAKLIYRQLFKLFLGYTFTDARARYLQTNQFLPLVPKHRFNAALIYEKPGFLKLGLEGYYTSRQYLYNGLRTPYYWEFGFMAEKLFNRFSVYVNFENFTDTRQSRYKPVVTGSHVNPQFDDIWTHTEGFVVNGGIKLKL